MYRTIMIIALLASVMSASLRADNVEVTYSSSYVMLEGDSRSNEFRIERIYQNLHVVTGLNGTTINGSSGGVVINIAGNLIIQTRGGNDFVDIRSLRVRGNANAQVYVNLGSGNDTLEMNNASIRYNLRIEEPINSNGDDIIRLDSITCNDLDICSEFGKDIVNVTSSVVNDYMTVESMGEATVAINHNDIEKRLLLDTGREGGDTVNIIANEFRWLNVLASDERDEFVVVGNHSHYVWGSIFLFGGNDQLTFEHNMMGDLLAWQGGSFLVDGGAGEDRGIIRRIMVWDPFETRSWEGLFK